jgi:uncharacterized protein YjlB
VDYVAAVRRPETHQFDDGGGIPNSRLPVLVYHHVEAARAAHECEQLVARNGWLGAWQDGVYSFHHFHSTTHEVLGIVAGSASVVLGGPSGRRFEVGRGDVLVLPAGTGHCNAGSSADLLVVGAYPNGMRWDLRRDALVVRSVLVPGLMLLAGKANWWLPRSLDRLLPRLNVEGSVDPGVKRDPHSHRAPARQPLLEETAA